MASAASPVQSGNREQHHVEEQGTGCEAIWVVLIILGVVGIGAGLAGGVGFGAQQGWWSLLRHLGSTNSLVMMGIGGGGIASLIVGIIVAVKQTGSKSSSEEVDTPDGTTLGATTTVQATRVYQNHRKADVTGTIHIETSKSGPIRHDQRYQFAKRLRKENGEPIIIKEDDFYVNINGALKTGLFRGAFKFVGAHGESRCEKYLPSSLFEEVKEGGKVRFYFDDELFELTCRQATHPVAKCAAEPFEVALEGVKLKVQQSHTQALWNEDLQGEPQFMGQAIGRTLVQINPDHTKSAVQDLKSYEDDQARNGPYQKLTAGPYLSLPKGVLEFNIRNIRVAIEEIAVIESTGFNGLRQLWILIPHKPENNQFPEDAQYVTINSANAETKEELMKHSFDPLKGHRLSRYHHGQYFMGNLGANEQVQVSFGPTGWLRITTTTQIAPEVDPFSLTED